MRFVIFGAGAIGGVVGARLHQGGLEVALIARGAHLEAIRRRRSDPRDSGRAHRPAADRGRRTRPSWGWAPTTSCCWPPRARTRRARSAPCGGPGPRRCRSSVCRTGSTTSVPPCGCSATCTAPWSWSRPRTWSPASSRPTAPARPGSSTSAAIRTAPTSAVRRSWRRWPRRASAPRCTPRSCGSSTRSCSSTSATSSRRCAAARARTPAS